MINNFLDSFIGLFYQGIYNLSGVVIQFMIIIASIDLALSMFYQYANEFSTLFSVFIKKMMAYIVAFALVNLWGRIVAGLAKLIFSIGFIFFGEDSVVDKMANFDGIFDILKIQPIIINARRDTLNWSEIGTNLMLLILALIAFVFIFIITKEIIIRYIEFIVTGSYGILLLPFLVYEQTKDFGKRVFNAILLKGCILMVALSLTGIVVLICKDISSINSNGSSISIGDGIIYIFQLALGAVLVGRSQSIGNTLVTGTLSNREGAGIAGKAMVLGTGLAVGAVGMAAVGAGGALGAAKSGFNAYKSGLKNWKGISKAVVDGASKGAEAVRSTRVSKVGSKVGAGIQNTVSAGIGETNIFDYAKTGARGIKDTVKEQKEHSFDDVKEKFSALNKDEISDNINHYKSDKTIKDRTSDFKTAFNAAKDENGKFNFKNYKDIRKMQNDEIKAQRTNKKDTHDVADFVYNEDKKIGKHQKYHKYTQDKLGD